MIKGILLTLAACFIWGLIFVVPTFLSGFSSIEIALGRHFFNGLISVLLFAGVCFHKLSEFSGQMWLRAAWFALIANIVYYTSIVLAVKYANAGITALIAGIAPVTISLYGNLKEREISFRKLILPTILISFGLIVVNIEALNSNQVSESLHEYFIGLFFAIIALLSWSWFVVANNKFLKHNEMSHFEWSTMIGVATFGWVIVGCLVGFFIMEEAAVQKYFVMTPEIQAFLVGTMILGFLCSWLGLFLWNSGSVLMPVSFAGQMTIFETVFGLIFVYCLEGRLPTIIECLGIAMMFIAIAYSMRIFTKLKTAPLIN